MINQKRLMQIEVSLTPKQAVLLWLRQEHQGKTMREYARSLVQRAASASPRSRVGRQVMAAIQAAMKGQDPARIQRAARQAHMDADFLILLVTRANSVVLNQSNSVWLRIGAFLIRLCSAGLRDKDASDELLVADLQAAATELFSIQLAVERIQSRHFDGECILAKDVRESLELPTMILRRFIGGVDRELERHGQPELVIDSDELRHAVSNKASEKALYICALAKSGMLQCFGCGEAANAVLRPYILR